MITTQLITEWGERLDPNHVLEEYPRPQLMRDSWLSLNGFWDYALRTRRIIRTFLKAPSLCHFLLNLCFHGSTAS